MEGREEKKVSLCGIFTTTGIPGEGSVPQGEGSRARRPKDNLPPFQMTK
jgi:hypothetical protein